MPVTPPRPYVLVSPVLRGAATPASAAGAAPPAGQPAAAAGTVPGPGEAADAAPLGSGSSPESADPGEAAVLPASASSTAPVPLVAGVKVPVLPAGVVDRDYWFAGRSRSPIRSLRPWISGPMRSAWSL